MKKLDITNEKFGRLTAIKPVKSNSKLTYWLCACSCGNKTKVYIGRLRNSTTRSCGCLSSEVTKNRCTTHGLTSHYLYKTYLRIKSRCNNNKNKSYADYGGRGITLCKKWEKSFESFYTYVITYLGNKPAKELSLDRINNNKGYKPGNIRWATPSMQAKNRRSSKIIAYNGIARNAVDWARAINIPPQMLYTRLKVLKWPIDRVLNTPIRKPRLLNFRGQAFSTIEWAQKLNIKYATLKVRINRLKWPIEKALSKPVNKRKPL